VIRYALACHKGHTFESWFASSDAYDKQAKRGLVSCPLCGSVKVEKALMAPQLTRTERQKTVRKRKAPIADTAQAPSEAASPVAIVSDAEREFRAKLREVREHLTKNSQDVGAKFPEEARKMHYGEADHRSIHGEASLDDAKALVEEGIDFYPLPALPEERN
jgi:hypothetical protein